MEKCVLGYVYTDAAVTMRQVEAELNVSHMTRVLHEQLLYPYHLRVEGLMPADFAV
jgi:hypothetical protein